MDWLHLPRGLCRAAAHNILPLGFQTSAYRQTVQCTSQANCVCVRCLACHSWELKHYWEAHHKKLQGSLIILIQPNALEGGKDAAAWACPPFYFQHYNVKEA